MTAARIIISYRRSDTAGYAGRLDDDLSDHFGEEQVFRDVEQLVPSRDFRAELDRAISNAAAVLVVIGPDWTATTPSGGQRLFESNDLVRYEIARALEVGRPVIPVLVGGAQMPNHDMVPRELADLASTHAIEVSDTRWRNDVARLLDALRAIGVLAETRPFPEIGKESRCELRAAWFGHGSQEQVRAESAGVLTALRMETGPWTGEMARLSGGSKFATRTLGAFFVKSAQLPSTGLLRIHSGAMSRVEVLLREDWGTGIFTGLSDKYTNWFTKCLQDLRMATET